MAIRDDHPDFETYRAALGHEPPDAHPSLADELRAAVNGEVRFDRYTRVLYSTDGSIYQAQPAGVVFPTDVEDVRAAARVAADHDMPVLPRGAGSSLAGQTVGPGCVVLDFSRHMDSILDVDPDGRRAVVEPGVVQDDLDDHLAQWDLKFAPDPASSNRATVGGGIGNNSTGAHSVRYGITDAYTTELDVVLADGSLIHTRDVELDGEEWDEIVGKDDREAELYRTVRELVEENEDEIEARYPTLKRSVSGYNLHKVVFERDGTRYINLSKLFVGAEGTLGVVVRATLDLVSRPDETALALYCFDDLVSAMEAVPEALEFDVSAVELMDDEVFRLARNSSEFAAYAEPIPEQAAAALMLEFDGEICDDFEDAIAETNAHFVHAGEAFDVLEAYTEDEQADLWKLRKAAIPLLMSMEGDPKPYPFIEDASVPPEELAEYVREFMDVLENHDTSAAYFAHAGSGTLHIRPILNLKDAEGIETMHSIADDVTSLVLDHHGSFSGEHGDGLARTEFNPKMYGPQLWSAFQELKTAFDPDWRLNPGTVVFRDEDGADMREHLRYGPEYSSLEPTTVQDFSDEGGFSHLVELCNGCGTCRQTGSETMCPSYRGMKDEMATTRGRANMLRAAISGEIPTEELYTDRFQEEVLDLCLGCKGCARDCPTGVDLAKLKAEVKHAHHEERGPSRRDRFFANVDRISALGSALAPVSNWATRLPGSDVIAEKLLGIAPERDLPTFSRESLEEWFEARGPRVPKDIATEHVVLVPDTFTNYSYPAPGKAAVRVLEAAGVHVQVPSNLAPSGRAAYSEGFLDTAKENAEKNVSALEPAVSEGWSVVFVEPSDAVMVQDEYRDLVSGSAVEKVAANTFGVCEFIDRERLDDGIEFREVTESLAYHGHCNQKALGRDHHAVGVLRRAGYAVDPLESGCCGMAGSFGYREEQYDLSQAIGRILFEQVEESDAETVVAPGASCRTQLEGNEARPPHPIEKVAEALPPGSATR
ncbi:FAD-linked oxidase domain protein [Haladaptatus paucihalophilus DX253]|uniref:FAD-linked oxidase domain protein n=1 Tax=Haladaptatus paucihalophilus DX253 TaxID=797209 RepID=E7QR37_HALPU|nr:FAD-binding and (Fe-S)-binding domain-containing protein [Haladaptatus paucihalophilus]EFW92945.1 FAD-linked oxidase domain protein [Haladaptatus paucihalophilus DX253]SHL18528.1 FAD/FMN-containing dehydrogenase [Haladaptatus paucihalophilus DX253]